MRYMRCCSSLSKSSLQAWTSTIAVDVYPDGPIQTQRLDILLGTGRGHTGDYLSLLPCVLKQMRLNGASADWL